MRVYRSLSRSVVSRSTKSLRAVSPCTVGKLVLPLFLATAGAIIQAEPAEAILNYSIYQSGADVILTAEGSLNLPRSVPQSGIARCESLLMFGVLSKGTITNNDFEGPGTIVCTGPDANFSVFRTTTPSQWVVPDFTAAATSTPSSISTGLGWAPAVPAEWGSSLFGISDPLATSIISTSIFANSNLASDFGFTTPGLITSWTLLPADASDPYTANDTINFSVISSPLVAVPGPLPLFGVSLAFARSRTLRRRRLARAHCLPKT